LKLTLVDILIADLGVFYFITEKLLFVEISKLKSNIA